MKSLVIVESPLKTDTIKKILEELKQRDFTIVGTGGHITNLYNNKMSVELKDDKFIADFVPLENKKATIKFIADLAKKSKDVFICTDDDREGEKIAEDLVHLCKIKKYYRVTFNEITKKAIKSALIDRFNIRAIDEKTILAQWTRRVIDRVIGYGLSPALKHYFQKNQSDFKEELPSGTGRVIALALNILCERQDLIDEYNRKGGTIKDVVIANYKYGDGTFFAIGKGLEFSKKDTNKRDEAIEKLGYKIHRVYSRTREVEPKSPPPPLNTLTLYTASSQLYELASYETAKYAKDLYQLGYINYPRTDSINLSTTMCEAIMKYLLECVEKPEKQEDTFLIKKEDILLKPRVYKEKTNNVQNAHEAIRPTNINFEHSPENIKNVWSKNSSCKNFNQFHFLIYELIWIRSLCVQLKDSEYDVSKIIVTAGDYTFEKKSNDRIKDGWEKYNSNLIQNSTYGVGKEDWKAKRVVIPPELTVNKIIEDVDISFYESHSKCPKRISEGALINSLTSMHVGRPSTIHTFSKLLIDKKYAENLKTIISPTDLGRRINDVTIEHLDWLIDKEKAKEFEKNISLIEEGKLKDATPLIREYWDLVNDFRDDIGYEKL